MVYSVLVGPDQSSRYEVAAFWESRPDQELIRLFVEERNGAAFAAIVHRHGSMVLGVCRRVLRSIQDAEDAFQAAFLVLVHKASSLREPKLLSSWLHGVALRTAQHSRIREVRRSKREMEAANMSSARSWEPKSHWEELRERLDAELQALPKKYRSPLVLCYLEGKTHAEAARLLGWPAGSISARVARGRELLRRRLAGRDQEMRACIFPFLLGCSIDYSPLPSQLVRDTVAAALAALPVSALSGPAAAAAVHSAALPVSALSGPAAVHSLDEANSASPSRARSSRSIKLLLTVIAVLMSFGAFAYALAGADVFGSHKGNRFGGGESQVAPSHSCH